MPLLLLVAVLGDAPNMNPLPAFVVFVTPKPELGLALALVLKGLLAVVFEAPKLPLVLVLVLVLPPEKREPAAFVDPNPPVAGLLCPKRPVMLSVLSTRFILNEPKGRG